MLAVPAILAPVPDSTKIFVLPATPKEIFEFAATLTLELPLTRFAKLPVSVLAATVLAETFPATRLPEMFAVPVILAPVPVIVTTRLPVLAIVILPFAATLTLELPLIS